MAIAAMANFALVLFDLTYVPLRSFWLLGRVKLLSLSLTVPMPEAPAGWCAPVGERPDKATLITACYDPIKGIEANRETQQYLNAVNRLEAQIRQDGTNSLTTPAAQATLKELRQLSESMVATDPFRLAEKSGTFERIKNRMHDRIYADNVTAATQALQQGSLLGPDAIAEFQEAAQKSSIKRSATTAFTIFWSPEYLQAAGWDSEIRWFNERIRPAIQTNYYRSIDESGDFVSNFGVIDFPFVILFGVEFLARTFYLSRRFSSFSWRDAMLLRWYDVLLFFPFWLLPDWAFARLWALLRVIPVTIRLNQARLIDLDQIQALVRQSFVASIAEEITEVVIVQVINQAQAAIKRGELSTWLLEAGQRRYIDLNNTNELEEISKHLIQLLLYQVLPKIKPDVEAILCHSLTSVQQQTPGYSAIRGLPGVEATSARINEQLAANVTQAAYEAIKHALEDQVGAELVGRLVQNFGTIFVSEARQQETIKEIQGLLNDLLEEIKINYVQRLADEDVEIILEQTRKIQQLPRRR